MPGWTTSARSPTAAAPAGRCATTSAELGDERVDAPAGTLVCVPPGVRRTAFAQEPGTTILVVGGRPGEAYEPVWWELWTPVAPLYNEGRYAEAAQRTRELVLANPGLPMLVYMLACCECQAGHTQEALEHLRVAVVSKRMRVIAANDPELSALHDEPAFTELIGSGP